MLRLRSLIQNLRRSKTLQAAFVAGLAAVAPAGAETTCPAVHITPPTFYFFSSFGHSVDIEGDRFIAGRPFAGPPIFQPGGAAEVYRRVDGAWTFEQTLESPDGGLNDEFGKAVAVDGAHALVAAWFHNHPGAPDTGAVYAFHHDGRSWGPPQELLAPKASFLTGSFGRSLDISGDVAIIGASSSSTSGTPLSGAAYIYRFKGTSWIQEQVLTPMDSGEGNSFGFDVAVRGNYALIGSPGDDKGLHDGVGSAYIFQYDPQLQQWVQRQKLVSGNVTSMGGGDLFGASVAISTSSNSLVAVISAYADDEGALKVDTGSAYFFRHNAVSDLWEFEQEVIPRTVDSGDTFGRSVAIDGDWAVIGADDSDLFKAQYGAAFVYHYDGTQWNLDDTLLPVQGPFFGWAVGLSGNSAIVSAHGEFSQSGAVYLYNIDPIFADLNCDNHVNGVDLGLLLSAWGPLPSAKRGDADDLLPGAADLDSNGFVNGFDLALLLGAWQ